MAKKDLKASTKRIKRPWPTKDAMAQIYDQKLWGTNGSNFYSGDGSHFQEIVGPYLSTTISFLKSFKTPLTVCDLGCGDFNVGKHLVAYTKKYVAVDIVPKLIKYNRETFKAKNLEFQCLDIVNDDLPNADCAILRQVLQHVSNAEIKKIVAKLKNFKYLIMTEHLPNGNFEPNKDIISGQGIRLKKQSGVNLLEDPFNLRVKEELKLSNIVLEDHKGIIETKAYTL